MIPTEARQMADGLGIGPLYHDIRTALRSLADQVEALEESEEVLAHDLAETHFALRMCLSYWLSDAAPEELQGAVEKLKRLCEWEDELNRAREAT